MSDHAPFSPTPRTAGAHRTAIWDTLAHTRQCSYPLPPHGHHPNFTGASQAARVLLKHDGLQAARALVVGPDRVLMPLRRLALQAGLILYVPNVKKEGWYWRLTDPVAAQLSEMSALGEACSRVGEVQGVVLACVAADHSGGRLSKGFGWGARGLHLHAADGSAVPEYTLAHALMLCAALTCPPDSRVRLIATPKGVQAAEPSHEGEALH